jgi:alkylhydroperoxidase family enzyme
MSSTIHLSWWQEIQAHLKQMIHFKPHELNIQGHNNDATVNHINGAAEKAIDALDPSVLLAPIENAVKIRASQLNGSLIPVADHQAVVDVVNAAIAAKVGGQ